MNKYFGTDGFRGKAGVELTALNAFKIGRFLGYHLSKSKRDYYRPRVAIGKDTRLSSYMLEYAVASGLASSGADAYLMHVIPTPALTYITLQERFDLGIMITASHNPYYDNGIKIIGADGEKINDALASLIEEYIDSDEYSYSLPFAVDESIGKIQSYLKGRENYINHLVELADTSFDGLKIGLDSANGSAFEISQIVFNSLGAKLLTIGETPTGANINKNCGSTHIENLSRLVKENGLDVGFAFDGDADRCIAVDKDGNIIDGDGIMYILAKRFLRQGLMQNKTLVTTVMSNGGLIKSLLNLGVNTEITKVGDRFVYERMQIKNAVLGGEQSGHIIMRNYLGTGDGIFTAIMLAKEMSEQGSSLSELANGLVIYPQECASVLVKNKSLAISDEKIKRLIEKIDSEIAPTGRILVRESGTEPKMRIMVEAKSREICKNAINSIVSLFKARGHVDV